MKTSVIILILAILLLVGVFLGLDPLDLRSDVTREGGGIEVQDDLIPDDGARLTGTSVALRANQDPRWIEGDPVGVLALDRGTASVRGTVLGESQPLGGAAVRVALEPRGERYVVRTKRDGTYEIRGLAAGSFDLHVTAKDYVGVTKTTPVVPEASEHVVEVIDLDARTPSQNAIAVRVTDDTGRPIPGANVLATSMLWGVHMAVGPEIAGVRDVREGRTQTDERGQAALRGLPAETYDVVVMAKGFETMAQAAVAVSHDRTTNLVFRMKPGVAITGVVLDPDGRPLEAAYVSGLHMPSFANAATVRTAADGSFELDGLRRGSYMVFAFHEQHGEVMANPVPSPSGGNRLTLTGSGVLEVIAKRPNGEPVEVFGVRPYRTEPFGYTYSVVYPSAAEGGRCRIDVGPGTYQLSVQTPDGDHVAGPATTVVVGETATVEVVLPISRSVSGVVVDEDGRHVVGAEVYVRHGGFPSGPVREHYARTDDEGAFDVRGLGEEDTKLRIRHPEYAETSIDATPSPPGQGADLTVRLTRGASVSGTVASADGSPVVDEQVNMFPGFNFFEARSTRTDASGRYRFEGVAAGTYTVSTGPLEANSRGVSRSNVVVGSSGDVSVDFDIGGSDATGVLQGRVVMAGRPVADATVTLVDERGFDHLVSVHTDEQGRFRGEGLVPGSVTVQVQTPAGFTITRRTRLSEEGTAEDVLVEFGAASLRGRLLNESGAPVSGAWVQIELVEDESEMPWSRVKAQTTTGQDGTFSAGGLEPGTYQVRISGTSHAGLLSDPIQIAEGAALDAGTYRVGAGRSIQGRVVDDEGRPVEDATISLVDAQGRPVFLFSMTSTGSDGRYQVGGLEPGTYTIGFEALGYAPSEQQVTVLDEGATADGRLSRGGGLDIQVENAAGEGLGGVRLTLLDARGVPVTRTLSLVNLSAGGLGITDGAGRASMPDLAPGRYTLRAAREGYSAPDASPSVVIVSGGTATVSLTMRQM